LEKMQGGSYHRPDEVLDRRVNTFWRIKISVRGLGHVQMRNVVCHRVDPFLGDDMRGKKRVSDTWFSIGGLAD